MFNLHNKFDILSRFDPSKSSVENGLVRTTFSLTSHVTHGTVVMVKRIRIFQIPRQIGVGNGAKNLNEKLLLLHMVRFDFQYFIVKFLLPCRIWSM